MSILPGVQKISHFMHLLRKTDLEQLFHEL
jgi:hypothetical protein